MPSIYLTNQIPANSIHGWKAVAILVLAVVFTSGAIAAINAVEDNSVGTVTEPAEDMAAIVPAYLEMMR